MIWPNIYGFSMWNLLHASLLASGVLSWLLAFWKIGEPMPYGYTLQYSNIVRIWQAGTGSMVLCCPGSECVNKVPLKLSLS